MFESCKHPPKEEVIPTSFGKLEGLWLYKDNARMRTDGSDKETLLNEFTVDGQKYSEGEFEIWNMEYIPSAREIFYILEIKPDWCKFKQYVWHYNYETKEEGLLYSLPQDVNGYLYVSDEYAFIKT